ncbi:MAG: phosphate uptake regulator PhoU, partial [Promethearchaeota archaeon]
IVDYSLISRIIERVGDHAVRIALNNLQIMHQNVDDEIIKLIKKAGLFAKELFQNSINAFFLSDISAANVNIENVPELVNICSQIENKALEYKAATAMALSGISESIKRTGEYAADLSEYIINFLIDKAYT